MRNTVRMRQSEADISDLIERASRGMLLNIAELVAQKQGAEPLWMVRTARFSQEETQLYLKLTRDRVG